MFVMQLYQKLFVMEVRKVKMVRRDVKKRMREENYFLECIWFGRKFGKNLK